MLEARLEREPAVRRVWQIIDLTLATIRGGIRFGLLTDPRGFDAIDEYDSREWLRLNGASESSLDSGYLRALYDFGFSDENGDVYLLLDFLGRNICQASGLNLAKLRRGFQFQRARAHGAGRGLHAADEVARHHPIERNLGQDAARRFGLEPSLLVKGHQIRPKGPTLGVKIAHIAVTHQVQATPRGRRPFGCLIHGHTLYQGGAFFPNSAGPGG